MHPQAIIVDGSSLEDPFLLRGVRKQIPKMDVSLLELPEEAEKHLRWITKLDSRSLSGRGSTTQLRLPCSRTSQPGTECTSIY